MSSFEERKFLDGAGLRHYDSASKDWSNNRFLENTMLVTGTKEEIDAKQAMGEIPIGAVVNVIDDYEERDILAAEVIYNDKTVKDALDDLYTHSSITYVLSKNTDGNIVLTGSDGSTSVITDKNTEYSFSVSGNILTITDTNGMIKEITLGNEVTAESIQAALGFTPASSNDIPTKNTVANWGFGTYTKPDSGIPKNDLASTVQTSLEKADTAIQSLAGYATEEYVNNAINELPEPMIFKGSLGTNGTITTLPTASANNEGFTYKVITDGTYASQAVKVGDTFISDGSSWVLIPSGDEPSGTVTSVKVTVPAGLSVSGSPITSSGTIAIKYASGYSIPTTAKQTAWDGKQDALSDAQMNAVNSGITSTKVSTYDDYAATINGKQAALSASQMNAVNSGITSAKVSTYDGYASQINAKANSATTLAGYGITDAEPIASLITTAQITAMFND